MSKAKTAKTASKNNPTSRVAAKVYMYKGQQIEPVKVINGTASMCAQYTATDKLLTDASGNPLSWRAASALCS